jgi:hypothetical protein
MDTYMTSDLYLSAFLKAKGLKLIDKKTEGKKVIFIFQDAKDREDLVRQFFNDGLVNITAFKGAIQDLKTMVYNV